MANENTHLPTTQAGKGGRIVPIDLARVFAFFIIAYGHMSGWGNGDSICNWVDNVLEEGIYNPSAVFFIFSGYFAARSGNWKKAVVNALWCFAAYAVWVVLAVVCLSCMQPEMQGGLTDFSSWVQWFGLRTSVFIPLEWTRVPIIGSYWYVRDLAFLLLLAPLLRKVALPLLVALVCVSLLNPPLFYVHYSTLLSPFALSTFLVGVVIRGFSQETQERLLNAGSTYVVMLFWGLCVLFALNDICNIVPVTHYGDMPLLETVLGMVLLYQTAVVVSRKFPRVASFVAGLAPVVFLAYVSHDLLRMFVEQNWPRTHIMALVPPVDFALCWGLYALLKRGSPFLLHLVAYCKVPVAKKK